MIKRIVIWGLKNKYHTHRHIHKAFYENAKKLGYETLWLEDESKNARHIQPNDLIIFSEVFGKMVSERSNIKDYKLPIRDDVFYCFHNVKDIFKKELGSKIKWVNLQVYHKSTNDIIGIQKWGPATYFDPNTHTLFQPWGTDLLPDEFKKPVFCKLPFVFWIGSIWNNVLNQGNIDEINRLKTILKERKIKLIKVRFVPDWLNIFLIRKSRIAPAITGKYQADIDYLPCRMFKNISYGQLGITNIIKFKEILGDSFINGDSIEQLISNSLSLSKQEYTAKVIAQQEIIKNYTYKNSIENIIKAIKIVS